MKTNTKQLTFTQETTYTEYIGDVRAATMALSKIFSVNETKVKLSGRSCFSLPLVAASIADCAASVWANNHKLLLTPFHIQNVAWFCNIKILKMLLQNQKLKAEIDSHHVLIFALTKCPI